jgi:3-(3-hydroxy-phenyl)propionate hydroxylase
MFCDPTRPTTLVPGPGAHRRWEFMLLDGEDPERMTDPDVVSALIGSHVDPALVDVIRASVYRFHALIATEWQAGRVFLAGDAAHQTPPFLGQGMCHGIRDVRALAWRMKAVTDGGDPSLLDSYQEEREPQVRRIIQRAVQKGRDICILDPERARARDRAVAERSAWASSLDSTMVISVDQGLVHPSLKPGASPMPQVLDDGELLDDALPSDFAVVTVFDDDIREYSATSEVASPCEPLRAFAVASAALESWLELHDARWAIVRPDRHPYAFASDEADLTAKASSLLDVLEPSRAVESATRFVV